MGTPYLEEMWETTPSPSHEQTTLNYQVPAGAPGP